MMPSDGGLLLFAVGGAGRLDLVPQDCQDAVLHRRYHEHPMDERVVLNICSGVRWNRP